MMARIDNFEDLEIWKTSRLVVKNVYSDFKETKDFTFKDQICRAAISVMNNISEGFNRNGTKEFVQFLKIAKGSAGEVKSMYYIAHDLNFIDEKLRTERQSEIQGLVNGISKLIIYLRSK
jgi:four helix bundle protein